MRAYLQHLERVRWLLEGQVLSPVQLLMLLLSLCFYIFFRLFCYLALSTYVFVSECQRILSLAQRDCPVKAKMVELLQTAYVRTSKSSLVLADRPFISSSRAEVRTYEAPHEQLYEYVCDTTRARHDYLAAFIRASIHSSSSPAVRRICLAGTYRKENEMRM